MDKRQSGQARFSAWLARFEGSVDDKLGSIDLWWNRTEGSFLEKMGIRCSRHAFQYLLLPALVAGIVVMGLPEFSRRLFFSILVAVVVSALVILVTRFSVTLSPTKWRWTVRTDMMVQLAIVIGVAVVVWMTGEDTYQHGRIYRHLFVVATFVVGAALMAAGFISYSPWRKLRTPNNYNAVLRKTELFMSPEKQLSLGWDDLVQSFLTVIPRPFQLVLPSLFPPAVATLLTQQPELVKPAALTVFAISYGVLFMVRFDRRLNQTWLLLKNLFFRGGALWVSLIVLALATARYFGVTYITTIFDSGEGRIIMLLLCFTYVLFWWYHYWVNRLLVQEMMQLLSPEEVLGASIPYEIESGCIESDVPPDRRVLQIHGSLRFIVMRPPEEGNSHPFFQAYSFHKLFEHLAADDASGGRVPADKTTQVSPSPAQISGRIFDRKYYIGAVFVFLVVLVCWIINKGVQLPELEVKNEDRASVQLSHLLFDTQRYRDGRPALVIAASGGGTRAALYTAAVMEGLAKQGKLKDVIMGSGVSGGGAALAYFAGARSLLLDKKGLVDNDWENFFENMRRSFIVDVVNSASEWRTVSSSRLGLLLSESFMRWWKLPADKNRLGAVEDFGLILNTAIAGKFTYSAPLEKRSFWQRVSDLPCSFTALRSCSPLTKAECRLREYSSSEPAGGRLILTNLLLGDCFVRSTGETGGPKGLPVVLHDPDTRLEIAAALNANFPPVFSNAGIDVGGSSRYWVTDGGAVDNRGVEMLLFALRDALMGNDECTCGFAKPLPKVTIVVVDASAYSDKYSQDRGISSAMGAGTQVTSLLAEEQLRLIKKTYKDNEQKDDFQVIYLPMPICLRKSGSFGTHWMLQPNIEIDLGESSLWNRLTQWGKRHILRTDIGFRGRRSLEGDEVIKLLRVMHGNGRREDLSCDAQAVLDYAVQDKGWRRGAKLMGFVKE